jgi:hypothetical protein
LEVDYPAEERRVHELLKTYTASRHRQAASTPSRTATDFVNILLKKRLFSSPKAFHETLQQHLKTLRRHRALEHVTQTQLEIEFNRLDEEIDDDEALSERAEDALTVAARASAAVTPEQEQFLADMLSWADRASHRLPLPCTHCCATPARRQGCQTRRAR